MKNLQICGVFLLLFGLCVTRLFGQTSSYKKTLKIGDGRGEITLLSYSTYRLQKEGKRMINLRMEAKNTLQRGGNLTDTALEIGSKKDYYFELRNGQRLYQPDSVLKIDRPMLGTQEVFVFTVQFLADAGDPMENFELRYAPKTGPQLHTPWLSLASFFAQGPQDTRTMSRYGYFTLRSYYFSQPDQKNNRKLYLNLKLGNDRGYSSYFVTGFLPNSTLIYAGQSYYFELSDGKKSFMPINLVPPASNERPDTKATMGASTERELIPSDVRELNLTFDLPTDVDIKQLKLRYRDPLKYVEPSDWLPLGPYMQNIPALQPKLKMAPAKKAQQNSENKK